MDGWMDKNQIRAVSQYIDEIGIEKINIDDDSLDYGSIICYCNGVYSRNQNRN